MTGYAQMTIRRNRDGSCVIITESTDTDPQYQHFDARHAWEAEIEAERLIPRVFASKEEGGL